MLDSSAIRRCVHKHGEKGAGNDFANDLLLYYCLYMFQKFVSIGMITEHFPGSQKRLFRCCGVCFATVYCKGRKRFSDFGQLMVRRVPSGRINGYRYITNVISTCVLNTIKQQSNWFSKRQSGRSYKGRSCFKCTKTVVSTKW